MMAPFKPSAQTRHLSTGMKVFEARILKEFAALRAEESKLAMVEGISKRLETMDAKLAEKALLLD